MKVGKKWYLILIIILVLLLASTYLLYSFAMSPVPPMFGGPGTKSEKVLAEAQCGEFSLRASIATQYQGFEIGTESWFELDTVTSGQEKTIDKAQQYIAPAPTHLSTFGDTDPLEDGGAINYAEGPWNVYVYGYDYDLATFNKISTCLSTNIATFNQAISDLKMSTSTRTVSGGWMDVHSISSIGFVPTVRTPEFALPENEDPNHITPPQNNPFDFICSKDKFIRIANDNSVVRYTLNFYRLYDGSEGFIGYINPLTDTLNNKSAGGYSQPALAQDYLPDLQNCKNGNGKTFLDIYKIGTL